MVRPILPIAGVPDELLRVVNDRLREIESAAATGVPGPRGPAGPAGMPGDDGSDGGGGTESPPPPNVLATSTAAVYYERSSHDQVFGFAGRIDLPTGNVNFGAHFKRIDVVAISPTASRKVIQSFSGNALSASAINYRGEAGIRKIDPSPEETWSVAFQPYNEDGAPAEAPVTKTGLVVYPAKIATLAAKPVPNTYYQDKNQGLHFQIQIDVTLEHQTTESEVSLWVDFDKGQGWVQQDTQRVDAGVLSLRIGQPKTGAGGATTPGDIWVPAVGEENWLVAAYPGYSAGTTTLPPGAVTAPFSPTVPPVGVCPSDDLTNAVFLPDPLSTTGDLCVYSPTDNGWVWKYYKLRVTLPTQAKDPWFWHCFVTLQKGHRTTGTCTITGGTTLTKTAGQDFTAGMVGWSLHVGTGPERLIKTFVSATQVTLHDTLPNGAGQAFELWNQAPDSEGVNEHPELYQGRWHRSSPQIPSGVSSDAVAIIDFPSGNIDFTYPLAKNPDQTTNLDRDWRFRLYAVSHANDNIPATGLPNVPYSFQTIAWPGGKDHFDISPSLLPAIHDGSQINDKTLGAGFGGGSGLLPFIKADPLSPLYADIAGLHFRSSSDYVVKENPPGSGHYELSQAIIDLAKAVNFNTTNFKVEAGAFLVSQIAVNNLIAGNALFAGQATFANKEGNVEGGIVTISSGGITLGSTITAPRATIAVNANGLSLIRDIYVGSTFTGRNRLDVLATGITIQTQDAQLNPVEQLVLDSGKIQIIRNNNSVGVSANGVTIADNYGGTVTMDSGNGIKITRNTNSVKVDAAAITLTDGFGGTVTMDNANGIRLVRGTSSAKVDAAGITLTDASAGTVLMNANGVKISRGSYSVLVAATGVTIATGTNGQQMVLDASSMTLQTDFNSYGAIVLKATPTINSIAINSSQNSTLGNFSLECTGNQQMLMGPTSNPGILKIETGIGLAKVTLAGTVVLDRAQVLGHHVPRYTTAGIPVMDDGELYFRYDGSFMQLLFRKGTQVYYWVEAGHVAYPF